MRSAICLLIAGVLLCCSFAGLPDECGFSDDVRDALDDYFFPEDIEHFDDCVLSGDWPSIYYLDADEILKLRDAWEIHELLVDFGGIEADDLSSVQVETIREWIRAGGHALLLAPSDYDGGELLDVLFGISSRCSTGIRERYELSEDDESLWLSEDIGSGIHNLKLSSYGYAVLEDSETFEMVSVAGGTDRENDQSLIGVVRFGAGFLIYVFRFGSGDNPIDMEQSYRSWAKDLDDGDFSRFALNVRQWAVDLALER